MGVPGLWEIFSSAREMQCIFPAFNQTVCPKRVAIDISIWLFQCAAASGGDDPILRTFFYRLCRLIRTNTRAIFVFDGPCRPGLKRGKRVRGRQRANNAYKLLIQHFGFLVWDAPGEAEAEAARLQANGLVDAVLSDDVDTFLFGATKVYKNWAAIDRDGKRTKKDLSHTWCYAAENILHNLHLDTKAMILIALLAGGDYFPAGLSNCGIKTAFEIAKAGYGDTLLKEMDNLQPWREKLQESLRTNADGHFTNRHPHIKIPASFPDLEILAYYRDPIVTDQDIMIQHASTLDWAGKIDVQSIKEFCSKHFAWIGHAGNVNVFRSLSPAVLTAHLCSRSQSQHNLDQESQVELRVHGARPSVNHSGQTELRVSYIPVQMIPIDMQDPNSGPVASQPHTTSTAQQVADPEDPVASDISGKKISPPFDCHARTRIWLAEHLVKSAYPQLVDTWYTSNSDKAMGRNKVKSLKTKDKVTLETFGFSSKKATPQKLQPIARKLLPSTERALETSAPQHPCEVMTRGRSEGIIDLTEVSPENTSKEAIKHTVVSQERARDLQNPQVTGQMAAEISQHTGVSGQSSIKAFFGTTKVVAKNKKTSKDSRTRDTGKEPATSEAAKVKPRRKIVIRQSLPGTWKKAEDGDNHHFDINDTIDLT